MTPERGMNTGPDSAAVGLGYEESPSAGDGESLGDSRPGQAETVRPLQATGVLKMLSIRDMVRKMPSRRDRHPGGLKPLRLMARVL